MQEVTAKFILVSAMDELAEGSSGINFIPCVKFVRRGVAKALPEQVKLSKKDLEQVIEQTASGLAKMEVEEEEEGDEAGEAVKAEANEGDDDEWEDLKDENGMEGEVKIKAENDSEDEDEDINKKYGLDDYDDEGEYVCRTHS